ncbi:MAG: response regulator [Planctomycetota bacterium]
MNDHQEIEHTREPAKTPKTPHVLLVEDDDVMRDMLAEAFQRRGWRVTECDDPIMWLQSCVHKAAAMDADALEYLTTDGSYDVVVSDIRMPNMSGLDVLRILGDIHCTDACPPTIFITAFGDEDTHRRARELGAITVLDKPFAVKDLVEKVHETVNA